VGEPQRRSTQRAAALPLTGAGVLQPKLAVGPVDDPFEREAERTADAVTASDWSTPAFEGRPALAGSLMRVVRRALGKNEPPTKKDDDDKTRKVQKASSGAGPDTVPAGIEQNIQTMSLGGEPLSPSLRSVFEPRFGYDFSGVRMHTGAGAAGAALALNARAFTVGDHIFFGGGEYQPASAAGRRLIAHELTHTIQQQPSSARTARLLQASPRVQRDWLPDPKAAVLAKVRQWAGELPPYELLTVLLGRDPITDKPVERSPRNWIHAALKLVPDGMAIFDDLEKNKTIETVAEWFGAEIAKLNLTWEGIKGLFGAAWDALDAGDILSPRQAWEKKIKPIFEPTLARLAAFAVAVGSRILGFIKKTVLAKLGAWAKEQRGYPLLTVILGKDPVTDEKVARTPKAFVKAALALVSGGDKIYENLEKTGTIDKTAVWLDEQIAMLDLTWDAIKALFLKAWNSITLPEFLNPITLVDKIVDIFGAPARRVLNFAIAAGKKVLEFIFEGAMMLAGPIGLRIAGIFKKIGSTFQTIVADPVRFVGYLVDALKLGFVQFGKNIWEHLKTGVIEWLVGALEGAGLKLPTVWDLKGIVDLVLQVLGITYAKIRAKLVKVVGEKTVSTIEKVFDFVFALVTEGPVAAWNKIVEAIGSLWDMVIGGIKDWAVTKIITAAITKLATMLNPAGAVIQAIIAIYNTVAFFVERINQIITLVETIVDSIATIASGKLEQAANFVERAMAKTLPVILGFLGRLIGLGDVSGAIKNVITTIQTKVDLAIDKMIAWIVEKVKSLFGKKDEDPKWTAAVVAVSEEIDKLPENERTIEGLGKHLDTWKTAYGFSSLTVAGEDEGIEIDGEMSPKKKVVVLPWPPGTEPKFSALSTRGYGTGVVVTRFPPKKQIPAGSTPGVDSDYYKVLNTRRYATGSAYYVKGHLLNHNIGGTGKDWKNLTPLTQTANNRGQESMLREFEKPVKEAIDKGWTVTNFQVLAASTINRAAEIASLKAAKAAEKPSPKSKRESWYTAINNVLLEEQFIPAQVTCSVEIVDKKGVKQEPKSDVIVDNDEKTSWLDYTVIAS
jgi:ribosomal protein S20